MIETEIVIFLNRKSDIELVKEIILKAKIQFPIYIFEYENHYKLMFISNYEEWEVDNIILDYFKDYEFTSDFSAGRKEIRLQISRRHTDNSTDNWNRPIENPLNETKYLIRKSNSKLKNFKPKIKVLFENTERNYYINIIKGVEKNSGKKGFLILKEFKTDKIDDKIEYYKDRLYITPSEALQFGFYKMQNIVINDFKKFKEKKKKELRKQERIPRKLINDFIKSCNKNDTNGILKNLSNDATYKKRINGNTIFSTKGKDELKKKIITQKIDLCGRELKINSFTNLTNRFVTVWIRFIQKTNTDKENGNKLQFKRFIFEINKNIISSIIEEI